MLASGYIGDFSMRHIFLTFAATGALMLCALPAAAQQAVPVETRVDRLEKELRAVQRKVFPAGAPVEPDLSRPAAIAAPATTSTPVSDLLTRVDTLEGQLATLTGQMEQNSFKLKQMEDSFSRYRAEMDARLGPAVATPAEVTAPPIAAVPKPTAPAAKPVAAPVKPAVSAAKPTPAAAKPATSNTASDVRKAAVAAVERPDTGNAAEDAYTYGYRLWAAKFYPEAQVQLKSTVEKHASSIVASRASNLLGRAYLDDGKPALASVAFYENYQKRPRGDRAADSLTWLGEALIQLKKPADACKVYAELEEAYGTTLSASLRGMMEKGRARAKCAA